MNQAGMSYTPPLEQVMNVNLEAAPGLVIKQVTQFSEALFQTINVPFEQANKYKVSVLPLGLHAATEPKQPGRWQPTAQELDALPEQMQVREESSCMTRCCLAYWGGLNLRPLTLHFMEGEFERFRAERACHLGACCGCPLLMRVKHGSALLGEVKEQFDNYCWSCWQCCCLCSYYTKVLEGNQLAHKYTLQTSMCCCGRVSYCCGATCCKNDFIIDILDEKGHLVATIQKTFAPSVEILEFPPTATVTQRALLLAAILSVEYQLFEETGGQDN